MLIEKHHIFRPGDLAQLISDDTVLWNAPYDKRRAAVHGAFSASRPIGSSAILIVVDVVYLTIAPGAIQYEVCLSSPCGATGWCWGHAVRPVPMDPAQGAPARTPPKYF